MKKATKRRNILPTLLAVVLALAGLGVLLYPTLSNLYVRYQISEELRQYNRVIEAEKADYSAWWAEADAYNRSLLENPEHLIPDAEARAQTDALLNPGDSNMLGYLEIPAIRAELPIYRGTEEKQLQSGAGWWIGSSLPAGGASTHCILTAHTGLARAKLFTDLDQLEMGDRFTVTVLDRTLTYEVDQILVTDPGDVEPLEIVEGEDYVTLYTCTPYGVNTHRLLVRGRRVLPDPVAETAAEPTETTGQAWSLWPLLLLLLAAVLLLSLAQRRKRECSRREQERR